MAVKVVQRSHGGRGGGGDPLGEGRAAQSHGEEIVVIFFIYWSTYSASSYRFFAVANATSFVSSRCAVPLLVFLVLVLITLHCCLEITHCPPCREHPQHFQQRVSRVCFPIPECMLAQEVEVPVQIYCQIVQGGGGANAVFVGEEVDVCVCTCPLVSRGSVSITRYQLLNLTPR
jgi:hypothetical protein